ncbi:Uncharacterised protein [Flavonifractor plautii]|nr:Uncharacterised protein [Flavonifractor plautii]
MSPRPAGRRDGRPRRRRPTPPPGGRTPPRRRWHDPPFCHSPAGGAERLRNTFQCRGPAPRNGPAPRRRRARQSRRPERPFPPGGLPRTARSRPQRRGRDSGGRAWRTPPMGSVMLPNCDRYILQDLMKNYNLFLVICTTKPSDRKRERRIRSRLCKRDFTQSLQWRGGWAREKTLY